METLLLFPPDALAPDEPQVATSVGVIFEDEHFFALDKSAPLPVHGGGRFRQNTLLALLAKARPDLTLHLAHRLDANVTGLLLLAKSAAAARSVQRQFADGRVDKRYLARVAGSPPGEAFCCFAPIAKQDKWWAPSIVAPQGKRARSVFYTRAREASHALLEARPLTGRTNQLRVHLAYLGLPIVGEQAYHPDRDPRAPLPKEARDRPIQLHSWQLAFHHEGRGGRIVLRTDAPAWAR